MPKFTDPLARPRNATSLSLTVVMHRHHSVAHIAPVHEHKFKRSSLVFSDKSAIRFIPRENGVHSIDVKFNGCHIPGSPFNVRVGDPGLIGDPGLVTAHGPGLQGGTTGRHHMYFMLLSTPTTGIFMH